MKAKGITVLVSIVAIVGFSQAAMGSYESIAHNLLDTTPDTSFDVDTGLLVVDQGPGANNITLNDPTSLPGTITLGDFHLETTFTGNYNPLGGAAIFSGGFLSLTFNYNGMPYSIGGPIAGAEFEVHSTGPSSSIVQGEGLWDAQDLEVLPGSGDWPDAGGLSSIKSITLAFGFNIGSWNFDSDLGGANTSYQLFPDDTAVPEPMTLALFGLGALALVRRRR